MRIDLAVAVVVDAIAARVDLALARGDGAEAATTTGLRIAGFAASAEVAVWRGHAGVRHWIA